MPSLHVSGFEGIVYLGELKITAVEVGDPELRPNQEKPNEHTEYYIGLETTCGRVCFRVRGEDQAQLFGMLRDVLAWRKKYPGRPYEATP